MTPDEIERARCARLVKNLLLRYKDNPKINTVLRSLLRRINNPKKDSTE